MPPIALGNLFAWGVQVTILATLGLILPVVFRITAPRARLRYLRGLLLACLVLPLVQPWVPTRAQPAAALEATDLIAENPAANPVGSRPASVAPGRPIPSPARRLPFDVMIGVTYAAGLGLRLGWTALGLLGLASLRRTSTRLDPRPPGIGDAARIVGIDAEFRTSDRVVRPATFGLRRPIVLVPPGFLEFPPSQQTAVAAHELIHIRRRDWPRALADSLVLSVCWFHPLLWRLVDQIHLSVEQVVDREVVALVGERKPL